MSGIRRRVRFSLKRALVLSCHNRNVHRERPFSRFVPNIIAHRKGYMDRNGFIGYFCIHNVTSPINALACNQNVVLEHNGPVKRLMTGPAKTIVLSAAKLRDTRNVIERTRGSVNSVHREQRLAQITVHPCAS